MLLTYYCAVSACSHSQTGPSEPGFTGCNLKQILPPRFGRNKSKSSPSNCTPRFSHTPTALPERQPANVSGRRRRRRAKLESITLLPLSSLDCSIQRTLFAQQPRVKGSRAQHFQGYPQINWPVGVTQSQPARC